MAQDCTGGGMRLMLYYAGIGLIGAVLAIGMGLLARAQLFFLMGLAPLFPAFALLAHILAVEGGSVAGLQAAATFGLYALIPYASYLIAVVILSRTFPPYTAIGLGILAWVVIAVPLVVAWQRHILPGSGS